MHFVNGMAHNRTLYELEHLWHWWDRRVEFCYQRNYMMPVVSSIHKPKFRVTFKLCGFRISYQNGVAPWDDELSASSQPQPSASRSQGAEAPPKKPRKPKPSA